MVSWAGTQDKALFCFRSTQTLSHSLFQQALVTLLPYARLHLKFTLLCFHGDGTGATSWGVKGEKMPREQSKPSMEKLQHQFLLGVCIHLLSHPRRSCGCGALAEMADLDSEARWMRGSQPWWTLWLGLIFYKQWQVSTIILCWFQNSYSGQ